MSNIIIIQADDKLANEALQYFKELDESHEVRISKSMEEFHSTYFSIVEKEEKEEETSAEMPAPKDSSTDKKKEKPADSRVATIDIIFFDPKLIPTNLSLTEWIAKTNSEIKAHNYFVEEKTVKFIISLDDIEVKEKTKYINPLIEDIIYIPYDRLLFLQKMEIIFALPKKTSPSFLFNQALVKDIEISKKALVTKISLSGISIVNPSPLRVNTNVRFHLNIQKDKSISFYGVVQNSRRYSKNNQLYEVEFLFFGTSKETMREIKIFFSNTKSYTGLIENDGSTFIYDDLNIFLSEDEKRLREVLVLDVDEHSCSNIKNLIESEVFNTVASTETSYRSFITKYTSGTEKKEHSSDDYAGPNDLSLTSVAFTINNETQEITVVDSTIGTSDVFLNNPMTQYFIEGEQWLQLFVTEESKELLAEALSVLKQKNSMTKLIQLETTFTSNEKEVITKKVFILDFTTIKGTDNVKIEIKTPDASFIKKLKASEKLNPKLKNIDLLIIDHRLIPLEPEPWIESVTVILKEKGYVKDQLKIIVTGDNIDEIAKEYSKLKIHGLFNKPLPLNQFLVTTAHQLNTEFSKYSTSNIDWQETELDAFVAVDGEIEALSEYGATLRLKRPINSGASLYIHGFIYDQAPNKSLCVKFYHSEEHQTEKGLFACSVIYFGINEFFLKYIRTWIRENYAAEKEKGQSN